MECFVGGLHSLKSFFNQGGSTNSLEVAQINGGRAKLPASSVKLQQISSTRILKFFKIFYPKKVDLISPFINVWSVQWLLISSVEA